MLVMMIRMITMMLSVRRIRIMMIVRMMRNTMNITYDFVWEVCVLHSIHWFIISFSINMYQHCHLGDTTCQTHWNSIIYPILYPYQTQCYTSHIIPFNPMAIGWSVSNQIPPLVPCRCLLGRHDMGTKGDWLTCVARVFDGYFMWIHRYTQ